MFHRDNYRVISIPGLSTLLKLDLKGSHVAKFTLVYQIGDMLITFVKFDFF